MQPAHSPNGPSVPSTGTSPSRTTGAIGASMLRSSAHGPLDGILFRRARKRSSVATRPSPRRHPPMPMSCESRNEPPLRGRSSGSRRRPPASCRLPCPRAFLAARESAARFGNCGKPRGDSRRRSEGGAGPLVPRPRNGSVFAARPPRRRSRRRKDPIPASAGRPPSSFGYPFATETHRSIREFISENSERNEP